MIRFNKHQRKGDKGESIFAQEIFTRYGLLPKATPHTHPFDFTLNGLRIEVKLATYSHNGYQANLRGHTSKDYDLLVIILCNADFCNPLFLIIPMDAVNQTKITIRDRHGKGKFAAYLNNWQHLERIM